MTRNPGPAISACVTLPIDFETDDDRRSVTRKAQHTLAIARMLRAKRPGLPTVPWSFDRCHFHPARQAIAGPFCVLRARREVGNASVAGAFSRIVHEDLVLIPRPRDLGKPAERKGTRGASVCQARCPGQSPQRPIIGHDTSRALRCHASQCDSRRLHQSAIPLHRFCYLSGRPHAGAVVMPGTVAWIPGCARSAKGIRGIAGGVAIHGKHIRGTPADVCLAD